MPRIASRITLVALLAATFILVVFGVGPARAAATNKNAKILLHVLPNVAKNACVRPENLQATCAGYTPGTSVVPAFDRFDFIYLIVVNAGVLTGGTYNFSRGVAGLTCGLQYTGGSADGSGLDMTWSLCATLHMIYPAPQPVWPESGGSILITWDATGPQCTSPPGNATIGGIAVAGYFYAGYYPGPITPLRLTRHNIYGTAIVANCDSEFDQVHIDPDDSATFLGAVGFPTGGINPCGREFPVAVEPTTWSGVKTLLH